MRLLTAAVATCLALASPAAADEPPPTGRPCSYQAVQWEPLGADVWNGELQGGPVVSPDGAPVSLTCSVHVNGSRHSDPAVVSVTGPTLPGIGVVAPTAVSFRAAGTDSVVLCTSAAVGSATWYWDGLGWSADPATWCDLHVDRWPLSEVPPTDLPPEAGPWGEYADCLVDSFVSWWDPGCIAEQDRAVCAYL